MVIHSKELQERIEDHVTEARLEAMIFYQTYLRTHWQLSKLAEGYNHYPSEDWLQENATRISHRVINTQRDSECLNSGPVVKIGKVIRFLFAEMRQLSGINCIMNWR